MAKIASCPGCSQPLQMEGVTAAQVRCPHCLRVLTLRKPRPAPAPVMARTVLEPAAPPARERSAVAVMPRIAAAPPPAAPAGRKVGLDFRQWPPAVRLLPVGLLALVLAGFLFRDSFVRYPDIPPRREKTVVELPIDPDPHIAVKFQESMRFGLVLCKERDGDGNPKRLTFADDGKTNNAVVQIDGQTRMFGKFVVHRGVRPGKGLGGGVPDPFWEPALNRGHWSQPPAPLGQDRSGRERMGRQAVYYYDEQQVEVENTVEIVAGPAAAGQTHRHLDTCLVRFRIKNTDSRPHQVAFRFVLDTFIGGNDGVPFNLPGASSLCDTCQEFNSADAVPDFIQALERPSLDDPGTVAHLTLRLGGAVEAPSRVTLGHWVDQLQWRGGQEPSIDWHFPVAPLAGDSCIVLYWDGRELQPGEQRELGFAYGVGHVSSAGGGMLGLTAGGSCKQDEEFTVTALVEDPVAGQTVTLDLPPELERVKGEATQAVPPLPPGARHGKSMVTWKVKATRAGRFELRVESNNGLEDSYPVTITSEGIFR